MTNQYNMKNSDKPEVSRRGFLKTGLGGAIFLSTVSLSLA